MRGALVNYISSCLRFLFCNCVSLRGKFFRIPSAFVPAHGSGVVLELFLVGEKDASLLRTPFFPFCHLIWGGIFSTFLETMIIAIVWQEEEIEILDYRTTSTAHRAHIDFLGLLITHTRAIHTDHYLRTSTILLFFALHDWRRLSQRNGELGAASLEHFLHHPRAVLHSMFPLSFCSPNLVRNVFLDLQR